VSLQVAFRADASVSIGTGHVMRCLTLARALVGRGHRCRFICRDLPGNQAARIRAEGHDLTLLPAPAPGFRPDPDAPAHAAWAGLPWQEDARETLVAAAGAGLLVVDHYAFDAQWEAAVRPQGARLVVLDDLADRPHLADVILDQNLGRRAADYDGLVPSGADRLIGPRHALLRPEFAALRPAALAGRAARGFRLERVLVSMGGIDLANATCRVLSALADRPGLELTVVMGGNAPALAEVQALAHSLSVPARVLVDTPDMAALMAEADLAIGAGGSTTWERCALGLPSLVAVLADNQAEAAAALEAAGAAIALGRPEAADFPDRLDRDLTRAARPEALAALSAAAAAITDGAGTDRVATALDHPLRLRPATMADAPAIWHWRSALPSGQLRTGANPPLADHLRWFEAALSDPRRSLFVAGDPAIAHLRLDDLNDGQARVSILLVPAARGKGLAPRLLAVLADIARARGLATLTAEVHSGNAASLGLFRAAGYRPAGVRDGFQTFTLAL
jgi:UDP-2,4-diacetamido-2,4,6-trideoxy-beta-L-altropyranose hydrolase